jgi:hypothetical protein
MRGEKRRGCRWLFQESSRLLPAARSMFRLQLGPRHRQSRIRRSGELKLLDHFIYISKKRRKKNKVLVGFFCLLSS